MVAVDVPRGKGDKLHDFEVSDPAQPHGTTIMEVKSYKHAAKVNELLHFSRYRERFRDDHGKWPDAGWYVVSQRVRQDPVDHQPSHMQTPRN